VYGENKGSAFLGEVGILLPDYTASHPKCNALFEGKKFKTVLIIVTNT
jgi:hypothetical protein